MAMEVGVWRLGEKLERVPMSPVDSEAKLEDSIAADLSIISPNLLLIGRQVATAYGKFIDLLAMDDEGNLRVIELKKDKTPRDVVAQALDYGSWVKELSFEQISEIYEVKHPGQRLEKAFEERFGSPMPEEINQSHELVIVASTLDSATERIINYLGDYGVAMNVVFFRHFHDRGQDYIARSWLISPQEAEAKASKSPTRRKKEPWNGRDFYVSFGESEHRSWEDARRYGFISGGQGKWYSQTLKNLFPGARVFVNIPKTGYVGIGTVTEDVAPVSEFEVSVDGRPTPILEAPLEAPSVGDNADDPELAEYFVRVDWLKTVPRVEAYWEPGLFAIQHTACKMRSSFTIERLTEHFGVDE